jgi:hypothetical protein
MVRRLAVATAAALTWVLGGGGAVRAASPPRQTCPIIGDVDADYVDFVGPAVIPGDGAKHAVTLFASEEEPAANAVFLAVQAHVAGLGHLPVATAVSEGAHDTTTTIDLPGTPGTTYRVDWYAAFDFGPHVCTSRQPKHHAWFVTVA